MRKVIVNVFVSLDGIDPVVLGGGKPSFRDDGALRPLRDVRSGRVRGASWRS